MAQTIIKDIDADLHKKVKARAAKEGHTLRWVFIRLLERYVEKGLT